MYYKSSDPKDSIHELFIKNHFNKRFSFDDCSICCDNQTINGDFSKIGNEELFNILANRIVDNEYLSIIIQNINEKSIPFCEFFFSSGLFEKLIDKMMNDSSEAGYLVISNIITQANMLIASAFLNNLHVLMLKDLGSENDIISHSVMKLARRIIHKSHVGRIILFISGFTAHLCELMVDGELNHLAYNTRTLLKFVILDPVFGIHGYSAMGRDLPSRADVINYCGSLGLESKLKFCLSRYLKEGNSYSNNSQLWCCIESLLTNCDETVQYYSLGCFSLLSKYGYANKVIESTSFIAHVPQLLNQSANISWAVMSVLNELTVNSSPLICDRLWSKSMNLLDLIINLAFLSNERTQTMCFSLLSSIIKMANEVLTHILESDILSYINHCIDESDFTLKEEMAWFVVSVIQDIDLNALPILIDQKLLSSLLFIAENGNKHIQNAVLLSCRILVDSPLKELFYSVEIYESIQKMEENQIAVYLLSALEGND